MNQRTDYLQIRLLPEEKEILRKKSDELGVPMGGLLRIFINGLVGYDRPEENEKELEESEITN